MKKAQSAMIGAGVVGVLLMVAATGASAHPGPPDNVWKGPLPGPGPCLAIFEPVHDALGRHTTTLTVR